MSVGATVRHHNWRPGEKERFSTANDIRSLELSLRVLRGRNPPVGRLRAGLIRLLGGTVGKPSELREIRRLEGLLEERRARLRQLRVEHG